MGRLSTGCYQSCYQPKLQEEKPLKNQGLMNGGAEEDRTPTFALRTRRSPQLSYRPKSSKTKTIQENSRAVQKRWKFLFEGQRGDHRRVVRGLFVAARFLVDVAGPRSA